MPIIWEAVGAIGEMSGAVVVVISWYIWLGKFDNLIG